MNTMTAVQKVLFVIMVGLELFMVWHVAGDYMKGRDMAVRSMELIATIALAMMLIVRVLPQNALEAFREQNREE